MLSIGAFVWDFPKAERKNQWRLRPCTISSVCEINSEISVRIRLFPCTCAFKLLVKFARFSRLMLRLLDTRLRFVCAVVSVECADANVPVNWSLRLVGMS